MGGYPVSTSIYTINRQCSSGLQAVANVASAIQAGHYDVAIGGGVECMSMYDMMSSVDFNKVSDHLFEHQNAANCLIPMGITSENIAEKWKIDRETQDNLAFLSHQKAAKAQKDGLFDEEITPVTTTIKDKKTGTSTVVTCAKDEGIREETTKMSLAKLGPAFKKGGSTTAGNSSQTTDGAAMVLLASRKKAKELGLPILGKFVSFAV